MFILFVSVRIDLYTFSTFGRTVVNIDTGLQARKAYLLYDIKEDIKITIEIDYL